MKPTFFQRYSVAILCGVFFLVPFALRGARQALREMKNDVKDWLPDSFPETRILNWFGDHFVNERFVVVTWPGCTTEDERFELLTKKLEAHVVPRHEDELMPTAEQAAADPKLRELREQMKVRQLGDRLGLFYTGDLHENWGGRNERWLRGHDESWYYLTPDGKLYLWEGGNNALTAFKLLWNRLGTPKPVEGQLIADLGQGSDGPNPYYQDPRRITARLFSSVITGPQVVEQLSRPGGPLWPYGGNVPEDRKPQTARLLAMERLTGTLFGRPRHEDFDWRAESFTQRIPAETLKGLPANWRSIFDEFVQETIDNRFSGERQQLVEAEYVERQKIWEALFERLGVEPPAPQTCIVVTLSEAGKHDMRRVVGRPMLGKPRGQLLALASECSVAVEGEDAELRMGGPPVDNVAIDEEGTITLFRLVGVCIVLGIVLSYICLRSLLVTFMVFLVGGISAVSSLSLVYWSGWSVDAVLMSMPSLVYVLGMSGAVHIVNYYRDACHETGLHGAPELALKHGWGPCTLAAFTTALGLLSLYASNLMPIKKFGLFSAIGVMATLAMLYTYLPAALQIWPPHYHKEKKLASTPGGGAQTRVGDAWVALGRWIIRHNVAVATTCFLLMIVVGYGIFKINTSVQLLKLFAGDARIIRDYRWMESNLGELVPMEIVVRVQPSVIRPTTEQLAARDKDVPDDRFKLTMLERMEISRHIQQAVERHFGPDGKQIVGRGMSAATFGPDIPPADSGGLFGRTRSVINVKLEESYDELRQSDYLRRDRSPEYPGSELWRISLRVGALNDVDYGQFVHELKDVVEPVLNAYRFRDQILRAIARSREGSDDADLGFLRARLVVLGMTAPPEDGESSHAAEDQEHKIDQKQLFTSTLAELLAAAGFIGQFGVDWFDPSESEQALTAEQIAEVAASYDCVVLVGNDPRLDPQLLQKSSQVFVDARHHQYQLDTTPTAAERNDAIQAIYTGVVPVVYKAQRTLLTSLIQSIGWAFVTIALVMMLLLRRGRFSLWNILNVRGGLVSMIPNVFPVMMIFGVMGHMGVLVDIGSMMTASVAMGVAVDDTIHFLAWFRAGVESGLDRKGAIELAYQRCAAAMTTTTIIGGLGLSVFMLSTFTPTQRFGTLMLTLLAAALVGDLIFLPALLSGPLGKYFEPRGGSGLLAASLDTVAVDTGAAADAADQEKTESRHLPHHRESSPKRVRHDQPHKK